jgi:hypothetical protein
MRTIWLRWWRTSLPQNGSVLVGQISQRAHDLKNKARILINKYYLKYIMHIKFKQHIKKYDSTPAFLTLYSNFYYCFNIILVVINTW